MIHPRRIEFWLLMAVLAVTVLAGITSSLWRDEAETWCIVKDGLGDAWSRAMSWGATAPLYYCLLWALTKVFGLSAMVLRVPSIVFSLGTAAAMYRLGQRWLDREGAALSVLFLFSMPAVQFTVIDARSYGLGLLLFVCAWRSMMRWLEIGGWRDGALVILSAAGATWAHYTVVLGLLPLMWYWRQLRWRRVVAVLLGVAVLLLPLAFQISDRMARRQEIAWSLPPDATKLAFTMLPLYFPVLVVLGGLMTVFSAMPRTEDFKPYAAKQSLVPLVLLAWLPPTLLFLFSRAGLVQLFEPKYLLCKEVGLALLVGWVLRGFTSARVRRATVIAGVVLAVLWNAMFAPRHGDEKWREASEWVRAELRAHPDTQLVLVSGFVESLQPRRLDDPAYREMLMAPQTVYPVPGEPILLPFKPNDEARRRLRELVAPAARRANRMVVVSNSMGPQYMTAFAEGLRGTGLRLTGEKPFGAVVDYLYERR